MVFAKMCYLTLHKHNLIFTYGIKATYGHKYNIFKKNGLQATHVIFLWPLLVNTPSNYTN